MKLSAFARHYQIAILMGTLVFSACTVTSVVLDRMNDRAWLYDLAKHPTRSKWDQHIDEVVHLVSIGDRQALSAARVLFPTIFNERSRYPKSDRLADEMYAVAKLNGVEKLPIEEQIAWIRYYDQHPPKEWRDVRDSYKQQHQEPFSMIPEPPELLAAATAPASRAAEIVAAAAPAATAPATIAAATQPVDDAPRVVVKAPAATPKPTVARVASSMIEAPETPVALNPEVVAATQAVAKKSAPAFQDIPGALHKMPRETLKSITTGTPAPPEEKPTPPDGAL